MGKIMLNGVDYSAFNNNDEYAKKSIYGDTHISMGRKKNETVGLKSLAHGNQVAANGNYSYAGGWDSIANGEASHAEGYGTNAAEDQCHAEGWDTTASGFCSHVEGRNSTSSGEYSHAGGWGAEASGTTSFAHGFNVDASNDNSCAFGHYNAFMADGGGGVDRIGHAMAIGNGIGSFARSNAFSVMFDGTVKAAKTITASTSADYAEFFEWEDGNPMREDRVGRFVTLHGDKIALAASQDDYILGVVSGQPFVLGNGDCDTWNGMFLRDSFGRIICEENRPKINPQYDPAQKYVSRFDRAEWAPIGMLGILSVHDDGSCKVNGYCRCNQAAIATNAPSGYRVIARAADNAIKIVLK